MAALYLKEPQYNLQYYAKRFAPNYYRNTGRQYWFEGHGWRSVPRDLWPWGTSAEQTVTTIVHSKRVAGKWQAVRITETTVRENVFHEVAPQKSNWYVPVAAAAEPNIAPLKPTIIIDPNSIEDPQLRGMIEVLLREAG
jgi:hypothetical protein